LCAFDSIACGRSAVAFTAAIAAAAPAAGLETRSIVDRVDCRRLCAFDSIACGRSAVAFTAAIAAAPPSSASPVTRPSTTGAAALLIATLAAAGLSVAALTAARG
jgi:hypothetical protein